ncbi:GDSL-type esterase/lipase family protein [Streptomyces orinoci]|uniref:GDSL-type esterase/lipase family protein n=1 Tax=Streptomyces orinoci TaxID=67339 RepID=A0ABV3JVM2_STRON|nr:GDSL-type esterase/lipase family protein [Streptomyces orinoci]
MFVGDSMTIGSAGDLTWRYRMWQHLCATHDGPFRIVGPYRELYDPATDAATALDYGAAFPEKAQAHLAGWGRGWYHQAPLIGEAMRTYRPDTLLVSLGLIDLGFYTNAEQTAANVRRFFAEAREANPAVRAVLLPVIHNVRARDEPEFGAECARFNELLAKTVADLDTPGSPLLLASAPEDWDLAMDTYDGTHPSARGEHRLARAFADAMWQGWGVGGPYGH